MTSARVFETSVTTTDNSASQDYTHPNDQTTLLPVTPAFKPFIVNIFDIVLKLKSQIAFQWSERAVSLSL